MFSGRLPEVAVAVAMAEIKAQVEFQLVIIGFHIATEFVKRFVVLLFPQVRQFVIQIWPRQLICYKNY